MQSKTVHVQVIKGKSYTLPQPVAKAARAWVDGRFFH